MKTTENRWFSYFCPSMQQNKTTYPNMQEIYMQRCLQLAKNGLGYTYPNPMVGSVIVHENKIIGEGWHRKSGKSHAEIVAIHSVTDQTLLEHATLYVNLEPCAHFGKTPPCAHAIVAHKIPKVVIGCRDFAAHVNGKGIDYLRANGVEVIEKILEEDAIQLNKRFFTFHKKQRPYIILKWAETANGYMASLDHTQKWISGKTAKQLVHKWRTEEQGILVGANTVRIDNPQLNARLWSGKNPQIIVLTHDKNKLGDAQINTENTIFYPNDNQKDKDLNLNHLMNILYEQNLVSVMVEGGAVVLQQFLEMDLWDEIRLITGTSSWETGVSSPAIPKKLQFTESKIGEDYLKIYQKNISF